jgi:hypothetical protein
MKLHQLLPLLSLLALVACVPTVGPTFAPPTSTPTLVTVATTAAPVSATPTASGAVVGPPSPTATIAPPSVTFPADVTVTPVASSTPSQPQWGHRTKTAACVAQGAFPDLACTTGDIFPGVTAAQVCVSGYSSSVRNVPASEKDAVYAEYGITSHSTGQYELDLFVSLELGGSNDISNLFPEAASPTPGFHEKDRVENYLHDQVCRGALTLTEAQREIATNWLAVFESLGGGNPGPTAPASTAAPTATHVQSKFTPPPGGEPPTSTQADMIAATDTQQVAPTDTQPAAQSGFTLISLSSPVNVGGTASASIQTQAGTNCSIGYVTPHGTQSKAQGLVPETAGGDGVCSWSWKIGASTQSGTGTVTITAAGQTQSFPIVIQ